MFVPPHFAALAANLLEMAGEKFSNHGCNDYDLDKVVPDAAYRKQITELYHRWNGSEDYIGETWEENIGDHALMQLMAAYLRGELDGGED